MLDSLHIYSQEVCRVSTVGKEYVNGPAKIGHVGTNYISYLSTHMHSITCFIKPMKCLIRGNFCGHNVEVGDSKIFTRRLIVMKMSR